MGQADMQTDMQTDRRPRLQEEGHLRLVHGVDARLQHPGHVVQVFRVLPLEGADVVHLLLLLGVDLQAHVSLALLQEGVEVVEALTHLGLLSAPVLLQGQSTVNSDKLIAFICVLGAAVAQEVR